MKKLIALAAALLCAAALFTPQLSYGFGGLGSAGGGRQVGVGFMSAPETAAGWYNLNPTNLSKWRTAMARVRAGTGRGRLLLLGDSTTMGAGGGSGGTANLNGAWPKSWPSDLSKILNSYVATSYNSFYTHLAAAVAYGSYDTRVTLGANWAAGTTGLFAYTTGAANNLTFTPAGQIDTIIVYMVQTNGTGTATFNVDGGASLGTLTSAGASAIVPYTVTVPKGTHTINIVPNNNGSFYVQGIIAYDSTTPAIDIINDGQYGSKVGSWTSTTSPWDYGNHLATIAPDLTIICLTINDSNINGSAGLSSYLTSMQTLITLAKAKGDVILMVGPPSNTTRATDGTLDAYISGLRGLAVSNNLPMLNMKARWVSYAVTNPLMPYSDALHPGPIGYQDEALAVFSFLTSF